MSDERVYPGEPAGPFQAPPFSFTDREGREIEVRASPPGTEVPEALVEMYAAFDPADRAQGIPPTDAEAARRWLETIYAEGYNAVAWHGDVAAGHATLVPENGGKADDARDRPHRNAGERPRENAGERPRVNAGEGRGAAPAAGGPYELAIFVLQSYQRAGIGTKLLTALLGYAQSAGIERVWLSVERWNHAAVELYRDVGFETVGSGSFELEMAIRL
jgi:GNAT superfamily N-acetyltransferase